MKLEDVKKIAVIGAGDMGHGIAQLALMAGYEMNLCDIKEEFVDKAEARIFASLDKLVSKGKFDASKAEEIKSGKLQKFTVIADAVKGCEFIIEVVPEAMDIKLTTLKAISDAAAEDAIIATNTSTMSITDLSRVIRNPERFLGTHYFNPPVLMKLVEVIKGQATSEATLQFGIDYVAKLNKVLVVAMKDRPGFIANRIAAPTIVYNGLQLDVDGRDPMDIDVSMVKFGHKMGPMELADYSRIDVMNACQNYYHEHLDAEYGPSKAAAKLVAEGHVGKKSGSGYYDWSTGARPVMDESRWTGTYDPDLFMFIEANEATKLFEEGVCSLKECDTAMQYGYNTGGPVEYIQKFEPEYVAGKLQEISDKYGYKIFAPTETIKSGAYKY